MITLIKGFNYDNAYTRVKSFTSEGEQLKYFSGLPSLTIDSHNYVKEHELIIKVPYHKNYLNGYNYVVLENEDNKVYYYFITQKEYLSEDVTRLVLDLDVFQTFMFDFDINKSFIERKHCAIDEVANFDEGLDTGEHEIESIIATLPKKYTYFALFNGIREQVLNMDGAGKLSGVSNIQYASASPMTIVDGIQYPCFFVKLENEYQEPGGDLVPDLPSNQYTNNACGVFLIPVAGERISADYGQYPDGGIHKGIDIAGNNGYTIYCPRAGKVVSTSLHADYGIHCVIEHEYSNGKCYSILAHMRQSYVKVGDFLIQGQTVGAVGSTGNSTGPHLHWEIRKDSFANSTYAIDPMPEYSYGDKVPKSTRQTFTSMERMINESRVYLPASLSDHPSLVSIVRFPECSYELSPFDIPVMLKSGDKFTNNVQRVNLAKNIIRRTPKPVSFNVPRGTITDHYPHTYYMVSDGEVDPLILKPELLDESPKLCGKFAISDTPVERYYIEGYANDDNGQMYNITNSNLQALPVASNEGSSWLSANAQSIMREKQNNMSNLVIGGINDTVGAIGNIATGQWGKLGDNATSMVGNLVSNYNAIKTTNARNGDIISTPSSIKSFGTPSTRDAFGNNEVRVYKMSVKSKYKEKIIDFHKMYGYKYNRFETLDHLSYKGYIKIQAPDIDGQVDNDYINKISTILERGVYIE